jgi:hypothetical protein
MEPSRDIPVLFIWLLQRLEYLLKLVSATLIRSTATCEEQFEARLPLLLYISHPRLFPQCWISGTQDRRERTPSWDYIYIYIYISFSLSHSPPLDNALDYPTQICSSTPFFVILRVSCRLFSQFLNSPLTLSFNHLNLLLWSSFLAHYTEFSFLLNKEWDKITEIHVT